MNGQKKTQSVNILMSKAIDMAGLVDYQDGAIVSKTVIATKTGTVTVFAFDQGQELSTHSAPFDALVQILDGEARITVTGKPLKVGVGEMIIMPANKPHALKAIKPFKMMLVMLKS
jgi:quercetin dioxygenase-like cupin family protein